MQGTQGTVLEALRRARDFLDANTAVLGSVNSSNARKHLDEAADGLKLHGADQADSARGSLGETAKQRAMRLGLRFDHMRPISLVARLHLVGVPEFEKFKMPPSNLRAALLIAAAEGMANASEPHSSTLIDGGLPPDYLEQFRGAIAKLDATIKGRDGYVRTRLGSTAGLSAEARRGRYILRVLDSLVRPKLLENAVLLAQWNSAKRIRRLPQEKEAVAPVETTGTKPVQSPVPAPVAPVAPKVEDKPTGSVAATKEVAA